MTMPSKGFLVAVALLGGVLYIGLFTKARWLWDPVSKERDVREMQAAESDRAEHEMKFAVESSHTRTATVNLVGDLARLQFGEKLLACTAPDRLLEDLGDVPTWEAQHKITGDSYYLVEYTLKFERCCVALRRDEFDVDWVLVASSEFYDLGESRAPHGAERLSDLLAATRASRETARTQREAEQAASRQREQEERDRVATAIQAANEADRKREAAAAEKQRREEVEQKRVAQEGRAARAADRRTAELRASDAERADALRRVNRRIERLAAARDKTAKDVAELRAYYEKEAADARAAGRGDLKRYLAWLEEQQGMKLPWLERAHSEAEGEWAEADAARPAELAAIERRYEMRRSDAEEEYRKSTAQSE